MSVSGANSSRVALERDLPEGVEVFGALAAFAEEATPEDRQILAEGLTEFVAQLGGSAVGGALGNGQETGDEYVASPETAAEILRDYAAVLPEEATLIQTTLPVEPQPKTTIGSPFERANRPDFYDEILSPTEREATDLAWTIYAAQAKQLAAEYFSASGYSKRISSALLVTLSAGLESLNFQGCQEVSSHYEAKLEAVRHDMETETGASSLEELVHNSEVAEDKVLTRTARHWIKRAVPDLPGIEEAVMALPASKQVAFIMSLATAYQEAPVLRVSDEQKNKRVRYIKKLAGGATYIEIQDAEGIESTKPGDVITQELKRMADTIAAKFVVRGIDAPIERRLGKSHRFFLDNLLPDYTAVVDTIMTTPLDKRMVFAHRLATVLGALPSNGLIDKRVEEFLLLMAGKQQIEIADIMGSTDDTVRLGLKSLINIINESDITQEYITKLVPVLEQETMDLSDETEAATEVRLSGMDEQEEAVVWQGEWLQRLMPGKDLTAFRQGLLDLNRDDRIAFVASLMEAFIDNPDIQPHDRGGETKTVCASQVVALMNGATLEQIANLGSNLTQNAEVNIRNAEESLMGTARAIHEGMNIHEICSHLPVSHVADADSPGA